MEVGESLPSVYEREEKNEQQRPAHTAVNGPGGPARDGAPAPGGLDKHQCFRCWEEWLSVREMPLRRRLKGWKGSEEDSGGSGMRIRKGDCVRNPKERGTCSVGLTGTTQ